jgi:hypothetical protein
MSEVLDLLGRKWRVVQMVRAPDGNKRIGHYVAEP